MSEFDSYPAVGHPQSTPYFIQPRAPLVFRSGLPFGESGQTGAMSAHATPPPCSVAGALRAALLAAWGVTPGPHDARVQVLAMHGGLLAWRNALPSTSAPSQSQVHVLIPRPADSVYEYGPNMERETGAQRLTPWAMPSGMGTDLPHGLVPLRAPNPEQEEAEGPAWWSWSELKSWLQRMPTTVSRTHPTPKPATRTHVSISRLTGAAEDEALFQTSGLDFDHPQFDVGLLAWMHAQDHGKLGPALSDGHDLGALNGQVIRMGADGRPAELTKLLSAQLELGMPGALQRKLDALEVGQDFRVLLLTPACFRRNGWYPDGFWPDPEHPQQAIFGCFKSLQHGSRDHDPASTPWRFRIKAAAIGPWQAYTPSSSFNDEGERGFFRRPLRRLVPAGSVYWLEITQKDPSLPLSRLWMRSLCLSEFARDGYGLAVPGL